MTRRKPSRLTTGRLQLLRLFSTLLVSLIGAWARRGMAQSLCGSCILPALKVAEIKWPGRHALRRSLATNLHDLGVDDHTIKAILRHSSVTVTQRSYLKSLPKQSVAAPVAAEDNCCNIVKYPDAVETTACTHCGATCIKTKQRPTTAKSRCCRSTHLAPRQNSRA